MIVFFALLLVSFNVAAENSTETTVTLATAAVTNATTIASNNNTLATTTNATNSDCTAKWSQAGKDCLMKYEKEHACEGCISRQAPIFCARDVEKDTAW